MLTEKLTLFHDLVRPLVTKHGFRPSLIADEVMLAAFPRTVKAAEGEGCDKMLRTGVISYLTNFFKRAPTQIGEQIEFDFPESLKPIIARLSNDAHYVPSLQSYLPVRALLDRPEWLDEARKFKRLKGVETLEEAKVLDELYHAVMASAE